LKFLKTLQKLDLTGTKVTKSAVGALREALPQCAVTWNEEAQ
jgi:hypothetical protein